MNITQKNHYHSYMYSNEHRWQRHTHYKATTNIHKLTDLTPSKPVYLTSGTIEHLNIRWSITSIKHNSYFIEGDKEKYCSLHTDTHKQIKFEQPAISNTGTSLSPYYYCLVLHRCITQIYFKTCRY